MAQGRQELGAVVSLLRCLRVYHQCHHHCPSLVEMGGRAILHLRVYLVGEFQLWFLVGITIPSNSTGYRLCFVTLKLSVLYAISSLLVWFLEILLLITYQARSLSNFAGKPGPSSVV